jgi:uncharacterized Zn finger protein (UPF0148 family)
MLNTNEEKVEFLNGLGFTPVSKSLDSNLEVKCRNGHVFKRAFGNFKKGATSCLICEREEKIEFLNNLGFIAVSENLSDNLEVKCKKGHVFKRIFDTFKRGTTSCPVCEDEEKIVFLNSLGFTPISKDLNNELEVRCEKGHTFKRVFRVFKDGTTSCPICEKEEKSNF